MRRRAVFLLSPAALIDIFKEGPDRVFGVRENGLPADAKVIGAEYDACYDVWRVGIESESLPEVDEGNVLPELRTITLTRTYPEVA